MTYDQWKTTDPRDYEPEEEEQQSELDLAYDRILELDRRNAKLVAALEKAVEMLEEYDLRDGGELYYHLRKTLAR
jgi:hypothetical protein